MTEDEAKTKWCPQVGGRPSKDFPKVTNCIASECMWWVWDQRGADVDGVWDPEYPVEGHCGAIK